MEVLREVEKRKRDEWVKKAESEQKKMKQMSE
jgi:hypothetical protein